MIKTETIPQASSLLNDLISPFLGMWDMFPMGVMVTDIQGNVVYYNHAHSMIDKLPMKFVLGKNVRFLYGPDPGPSLVMSCLENQKQIINYVCVYRTVKGEAVNSAHWIFPIIKDRTLLGCMGFVQELDTLTEPSIVSNLEDLPGDSCGEITFTNLVSKNSEMLKAINSAKLAAENQSPVLLYGETGTGKDIFARSIHGSSMNQDNPFIALNCAAIPENLMESILFGTTKGAFTGALDKSGLFEQANSGSLFLDEIDSMPLILQPKLLRVLQDKKVRQMGGAREIQLNLKIIATMSQDPLAAINSGKLRPDLFYRLGVSVIGIPPLRERCEDIPDLCTYFILKYDTLHGKKVKAITSELLNMFCCYSWPGNVRELEHIIEASMNNTHDQEFLKPEMVPDYFLQKIRKETLNGDLQQKRDRRESWYASDNILNPFLNLKAEPTLLESENEKNLIINALTTTFGNVTMAARIIGVSRQNLSYKLKKYGLNRKNFRLPL